MAHIIARYGPCAWQQETTQNIFEALLESIIYQQLNGRVAATITERVKALFPGNTKRVRTRRGLVPGFPSPEQILAASEELLRSAGLSRSKMLAIRDLAAKTLDGTVPTVREAQRMSDDELIDRIDTVRGIGRWTVEMLLIFRLGRPDVLPVDDYGVRKGFAKLHKLAELPKPKELLAYGERWRPYRSVASWYMWRAAEMKDLPMAGPAAKKTAAEKKPEPGKKNPAAIVAKTIARKNNVKTLRSATERTAAARKPSAKKRATPRPRGRP
jgi:3-methyladenine DNA glycosylase/8-oxoguanine DNA glycosylase